MSGGNGFLIKWSELQDGYRVRYPYGLSYEGSVRNAYVEWSVCQESYARGVEWSEERCQQYYYIGTSMMGSIVCERCIIGAKYALFSIYDDGYVNKMHIHSKHLAKCLYCERRIASSSVRQCDNSPLGAKQLYSCRRRKVSKS
ncbi:unnamed protein product [Acanthoscelides obtectus]|uniref:Uncharacterized protein n=1 Tax=Acanthoscelides obtectus TaxID=200917 RepID=A0A9P0QD11_ACAOB|nr:unnamed protein product [Acanthoscelides obtectus]CAK1623341.1 hypothetical protein AOBTE_LOCUS1940 [Acanthoscelides obtectus]